MDAKVIEIRLAALDGDKREPAGLVRKRKHAVDLLMLVDVLCMLNPGLIRAVESVQPGAESACPAGVSDGVAAAACACEDVVEMHGANKAAGRSYRDMMVGRRGWSIVHRCVLLSTVAERDAANLRGK